VRSSLSRLRQAGGFAKAIPHPRIQFAGVRKILNLELKNTSNRRIVVVKNSFYRKPSSWRT